ncbi:MAG TPA: sugar ABC transporter permease [Clostridiales bacterium]|nr:sugar ABC transporter permease [Clostridiales bacterium]
MSKVFLFLKKLDFKKHHALYVMALPAVLVLLIFAYIPMFGLIMAFQDLNIAKGIFGSDFVGLKNFQFLFTTTDAWVITRNTVCYNVVFIFLNMFFAVLLSILLNEIHSKILAKTLQTQFIMPYFLSMTVVSIIVYSMLSLNNGYLNRMLMALGYNKINWYMVPKYWPFILVAVNLWKGVGYQAVVYLASISGISEEYYEVAVLEGASKFQQALYITLPHLKAIITIMLILSIGGIFRADFGLFYTVPQNSGPLYPVTDVIDTYIYRSLTTLNNAGMATAAGLYQSIVGFILVLAANKLVTKVSPENAMF